MNLSLTNTPLVIRSATLCLLLSAASGALADPASDELIATAGIPPADVARLQQGEIVSFEVSEPTGKSLASGIAMYLKAPPEKVVEKVRRGALLPADPDLIAFGILKPGAGAEAFKKFAYTKDQADEAGDLLKAKGGSNFNLSKAEIAAFNSVQADADNPKALIEAASAQYRKLLAERLQAYQQKGLAGVAAYDRGNGEKADPAAELATDTRDSKVLARSFPLLHQAVQQFPAALSADMESQYLWFNRKVQDRPTPVLAHRIYYTLKDGAATVHREFYVGHSYNSSQAVAGSLPYLDGALVVYGLRSSTDQVAGMGQSLKHSIGREQLKKEIIKKFQRLKAALKG